MFRVLSGGSSPDALEPVPLREQKKAVGHDLMPVLGQYVEFFSIMREGGFEPVFCYVHLHMGGC